MEQSFLGYALDEWESEVGTFCALLIFPLQYWFMTAIILSVNKWFNAHTVMKSDYFRVSFAPKQIFLFIKPTIAEFIVWFFFFWGQFFLSKERKNPGIECFSLKRKNPFLNYCLGKCPFVHDRVHDRVLWLCLVPLRTAFIEGISSKWFLLGSRESSLECIGLIIAKAGVNFCIQYSWTYKPLLILFLLEVRKPHCFHNLPKLWPTPKVYPLLG